MKKSTTPSPGKFISLEGCEGCGKSTQASLLKSALEAQGLTVVMTREPGGTPTGEMIRDLLQHHASGEEITPIAEVMLFAASRAQHVHNVIRPALAQGQWVICDRFVDSSLAYQAGGRELGLEKVLAVNEVALDGCWPDCTLWFDLPVTVSSARVAERGVAPDRFESEALSFHQRVVDTYEKLYQRFPERMVRVDAELSIAEVEQAVRDHLQHTLGVSL
ncbi:dTMP kinase [Kiritimatiellota bacterium B12222]|nr:dTMP kinase [Kiritimatiellota bacterium B12222]